jgi:S-adenosyl-L-methionine hydrolase (adenosine-forming)
VSEGPPPPGTPTPARPSLAITFLTDSGTRDSFTGVCRAVINRLAPGATVIDLTHQVTPGDIRQGALVLDTATSHTGPVVNLAVVDPGVGTSRRAIAVAAGEQFFVGPDNGLLWLAIQRAGGASQVVEISSSPVRLRPTGHTFHGRDLFSPVAAAIASGIGLAELGEPFDPAGIVELELPRASYADGVLSAHVLFADGFGNLTLDAGSGLVERTGFEAGHTTRVQIAGAPVFDAPFARTFADASPGEPLLFIDSTERLALAINGDSAEGVFGLGPDDQVLVGKV